ncbi:replication protein A 70 kDa DNA-binding subunit C-like protein [Tanacetum coccineum]
MSTKPASTSLSTKIADMVAPLQSNPPLFLDELKVDSTGSIIVMVGRVWDVNATTGRYLSTNSVVSNSKGNMIHCTAKATIAHNFLRLKEGGNFLIKNFVVLPNKDKFWVFRHDMFMLEFDGLTTIRKVSANSVGFVRYTFQLVNFDDIKLTNNKYMIDVNGYVTNVGRTTYTKSGSKTLDFYLASQRGQSLRVTLSGGIGDSLIKNKTSHVGMCAIVLTLMTAKTYNNKLYLSSTSSTIIYDNDDISSLQELRSVTSLVEPNKEMMMVDSSQPREGTVENLLLWTRNRKNNVCGDLPMQGKFLCETCNRTVDYPVLRYRLEVVIADDTAHTVVIIFNEIATELLNCYDDSLIESVEDDSGLPTAIKNLIGTTHVMELKSHTYYESELEDSYTDEVLCSVKDPHEINDDGPVDKKKRKM